MSARPVRYLHTIVYSALKAAVDAGQIPVNPAAQATLALSPARDDALIIGDLAAGHGPDLHRALRRPRGYADEAFSTRVFDESEWNWIELRRPAGTETEQRRDARLTRPRAQVGRYTMRRAAPEEGRR